MTFSLLHCLGLFSRSLFWHFPCVDHFFVRLYSPISVINLSREVLTKTENQKKGNETVGLFGADSMGQPGTGMSGDKHNAQLLLRRQHTDLQDHQNRVARNVFYKMIIC